MSCIEVPTSGPCVIPLGTRIQHNRSSHAWPRNGSFTDMRTNPFLVFEVSVENELVTLTGPGFGAHGASFGSGPIEVTLQEWERAHYQQPSVQAVYDQVIDYLLGTVDALFPSLPGLNKHQNRLHNLCDQFEALRADASRWRNQEEAKRVEQEQAADWEPEAIRLIQQGDMIAAIRHARMKLGFGLREAKDACERLRNRIRGV